MDDDEIEHIYLDDEPDQPSPPPVHHQKPAVENEEARKKFKYLLIGIFLVAAMLTIIRGIELQRFIADFMAVSFITFAAFKFADIETFAHNFRQFDRLAATIRPWGYAVPFVEAFMGFWYLLSEGPTELNVIAMLLTGTAAFSIMQAKHKTVTAAFSPYIPLPLIKVSRLEYRTLFLLATAMLVISLL